MLLRYKQVRLDQAERAYMQLEIEPRLFRQ